MITPIEIQSKTFKSGGLGYDKKDVDGFLREVLRSYEQIYRENMELSDKVAVLTEGIQYYKTIEKTLQKALVLAEKTAEDTKSAALEKAKAIEKEAHTRSQLIVADAKNELEHIHNQTIQLIQQYEKYKQQFKHLALAQTELIESECFNINIAQLDAFIDTKQAGVAKKESPQDLAMKQEERRSVEQGQAEQRQIDPRQAEQRQVETRQAGQRQVEPRQAEQRQVEQRQVEQRYSDNRHSDDKHTDYKHTETKHSDRIHSDHKHSVYRPSENNQYDYNQVDSRQPMQKKEKQYSKQEDFQVEMEPSYFDALEQVSATQEDMDRSYGNVNRYDKEDEEDYPYDQKNELENQDEFSFINLVDEED